jgi:hypothetical protein
MKLLIPMGLMAGVLLTSGCATFRSSPTVSQASSDSVTYRIKGNQLSKTVSLAEAHCATYGRRAVQDRVSRGSGNDRIVSYNCR